jgi:hypothetical protein
MTPRRRGDAHGTIEPGEIHMKKSKYSESQIVNILKEAEAGVALDDLIWRR